jgi:hypothetical protein
METRHDPSWDPRRPSATPPSLWLILLRLESGVPSLWLMLLRLESGVSGALRSGIREPTVGEKLDRRSEQFDE